MQDGWLTFDDGPGPSTPALLDVLAASGVRATFFVLGCHLASQVAVVRRALAEGHRLGNHTWHHARPTAITAQALRDEIAATDRAILALYRDVGIEPPAEIPLRLPYGVTPDDPRLPVLQALGRPHTGWTLLLDDWQRPPPAPAALLATMQAHLAAQARLGRPVVLCLHDGSRHGEDRPATVAAVRDLLAAMAWA